MAATQVPRPRFALLRLAPASIAFIVMSICSVASAFGAITLSGTKTGVALALGAAAGPFALYGALLAPLVFPFTFFIFLVPFDNLLAMPTFGTLTRALAIACGGSLVFWLLRTRRIVAPDRALVVWLLFYAWALASAMWAIDPGASYAHLFTLFQLMALYAVASLMPVGTATLRIIVIAVILSGAAAGTYGAYLFHHGIDISKNGRLFIANDENVVDPNQFAAALILPLLLAIAGIVYSKGFLARVFLGGSIVAMGAGVAVAGSRGGLLALGAAIAYLLVRSSRNRFQIIALGIGGIGVAIAAYGNVISRFSNAASSGGAGRSEIWRVGLSALRDHFWFGAGFSNFPLAFDRAFLSVSESYYTHWHRAPHSILISTSVELGIVGLGILVFAWWTQFRSLSAIDPAHWLFPLRTAIEASIIGLFVAALFLDVMTTKYLWLAFITCALLRNATLNKQGLPHENRVSSLL